MKPDLTEMLLRLRSQEHTLLWDLYNCRFAGAGELSSLGILSGGDPEILRGAGLVRSAELEGGWVHWLTRRGERAAKALGAVPGAGSGAYAALRLPHELLRAALYIALRQNGMPPERYAAEPRFLYRSAGGLGERTLVPDAAVFGQGGPDILIEVDRGTEGPGQLRHKWLRYREWLFEQRDEFRILALAPQSGDRVRSAAGAAGLRILLAAAPEEAARMILGGEEWQ